MMDAPFQGFSPELLAKIAQGAFRPPQAMGMQAPQMQPTPGFNMGDGMAGLGMAGLGMGIGALARKDAPDGRTTPEGNISGFGMGGGPKGPSGGSLGPDSMVLPYDSPSFGDLGGGRGVQQLPSGGGNFWQWMKGLF